MRRLVLTSLLAALALVGCGRLNRAATINQVNTTSGSATAAALTQQLANRGAPGAHVSCAKTLIVNVGTTNSCTLTGVGKSGTVRFTFSSAHGDVDAASVKTP